MSKIEYQSVFVSTKLAEAKRGYKHYTAQIDGVEMARDMQLTIEKMAAVGFELDQTLPITSTKYYGRVYTDGVVLVFKKNHPSQDEV